MTALNDSSVQSALWHGPGRFSAVVSYRAGSLSPEQVRARAASVMNFFDEPREMDRARAVVGVSPAALEGLPGMSDTSQEAFPVEGLGEAYVRTPGDVLVQLAAESDVALRRALRVVAWLLGAASDDEPGMTFVSEICGTRLFNGEEAFGFRDGVHDPIHASEVLAGCEPEGAWLLFQLYRQDVRGFFAENATAEDRSQVMGRPPNALPVDENDTAQARALVAGDRERARASVVDGGPPNSHWGRMRPPGHGRIPIVRRGFPCRFAGGEGLSFVAVGATTSAFRDALGAMVRREDGEQDRLLSYIEPVEGNVYFCPADPKWLADHVPTPRPSTSAKQLDRLPPVADYLVVRKFLEYLMELRRHGLFDDPNLPSQVSVEARPHLDALYRALAQGTPGIGVGQYDSAEQVEQRLRQLEQETIEAAVALNGETDEYLSFG